MDTYNHILLAVDFSGATETLLQRTVALRQFCGADLSLVHVIEPMVVDPSYDVFPAIPLGLEQEAAGKAQRELIRLGDRLAVPADHCHVMLGSTKSEILRCAKDCMADLIIVGSHGRHGVALLLGSTANAVLHGAPCDVLAVRIK
ncbi:MAG: universal stress protein [Gammaproteobacteria bacterium HGW-Gammaproteobacteria-1]|jgi:universal stress protein A|nr:MAG: universal stress protein [Gammaproteobacteria bacterium HGW-Gammaproteobacteria-1]